MGTNAADSAEWTAVQQAVVATWHRIERQLAERFPQFELRLGGPATAAEVAACETALGFRLPAAFAASCLVHRRVAFGGWVQGMDSHDDLLELPLNRDWHVELNDYWTSDRPDTEIRQDRGGRRGWVPLLGDAGSAVNALDLEPAAAGTYGQIINLDHGCPNGAPAPGWLSVLHRFAEDLEQGRYELDRDGNLCLRR